MSIIIIANDLKRSSKIFVDKENFGGENIVRKVYPRLFKHVALK